MAGTDASEGQALWQPGGAEKDSHLREGNRHLHLAYNDDDEEEDIIIHQMVEVARLICNISLWLHLQLSAHILPFETC